VAPGAPARYLSDLETRLRVAEPEPLSFAAARVTREVVAILHVVEQQGIRAPAVDRAAHRTGRETTCEENGVLRARDRELRIGAGRETFGSGAVVERDVVDPDVEVDTGADQELH